MFDFDGLEDEEPSPSPVVTEETVETLNAAEAEQAIARLQDERFTVRRDACKALAALGHAADARHADSLGDLLAKEEDYEVQKAAVAALKAMAEAGVHPLQSLLSHREPGTRRLVEKALQEMEKSGICVPVQPTPTPKVTREEARVKKRELRQEVVASLEGNAKSTEFGNAQLDVPQSYNSGALAEYPWPCVLLQIFADVLPMRVESHSMTPQDLIHIWEHEWRVPYASRIKFAASEDAGKKFLHPQEDIVPGSPCEVRLHAGSGSILEGLAVALKRYGNMDLQEYHAEKNEQEQKKVVAAEIRKRDDARQLNHWQELERAREVKMASPHDAERRRLQRIKEATPWRLQEVSETDPRVQRSAITPYS